MSHAVTVCLSDANVGGTRSGTSAYRGEIRHFQGGPSRTPRARFSAFGCRARLQTRLVTLEVLITVSSSPFVQSQYSRLIVINAVFPRSGQRDIKNRIDSDQETRELFFEKDHYPCRRTTGVR
jgi:hypothetical protein